jgi:hypothetical protein
VLALAQEGIEVDIVAEIGKLTVKLQAETAEFSDDLGKVQGNLDDLADRSESAGGRVSGSMREGREGVMLLEEATGVHLPRALTSLIASIGPVGAAFTAMLPILGVVAAIEVVSKLVQAHEKAATAARELGNAEVDAGTKSTMVLQGLGDRLIEAGIKADELAGNHIGALNKQLELLDHQSLKELMDTFDKFGGEADQIFAKVKANNSFWEVFKSGSDGAKSAINDFKTQYDALIAKGDTKGAGDLLKGTLDSALKVQRAQQEIIDITQNHVQVADHLNRIEADNAILKEAGIGADKDGLAVQQAVVDALQDQQKATALINQTRAVVTGNDRTGEATKSMAEQVSLVKTQVAGLEQKAAMVKKVADAEVEANLAAATKANPTSDGQVDKQLAAHIAADQAEYTNAVTFAQKTLEGKREIYEAEVKAAAGDLAKKRELEAQYANDVSALYNVFMDARAARDKKDVEATADADKQKTALDEEAVKRKLGFAKEASDQSIKFAKEAFRVEDEQTKLSFASQEEAINSAVAHETMSWKQAHDAKIALINQETSEKEAALAKEEALEVTAIQKKIQLDEQAALAESHGDKTDPKYIAFLNQQKLLLTEIDALQIKLGHDQQLAAQQGVAAIQKEKDALTPLEQKMKEVQNQFNADFAKMVTEGKNFGKSMQQLATQMAEQFIEMEMKKVEKALWGDIQRLIHHETTQVTQKASDTASASAAAATAIAADKTQQIAAASLAGANMMASFSAAPWPIDTGAGAAATAAMTAALAFAEGGLVPGSGTGDTVPAMLSPGETVVSRALTEQVASNTGSGGKGDVHHHNNLTYAPNVSAIDSDGVEKMLKKHAATFSKHVNAQLRKQNKRAA